MNWLESVIKTANEVGPNFGLGQLPTVAIGPGGSIRIHRTQGGYIKIELCGLRPLPISSITIARFDYWEQCWKAQPNAQKKAVTWFIMAKEAINREP